MKRFLSVVLSLALLLSCLSGLSLPALADPEALLAGLEDYDFLSAPGGKINASTLQSGSSYYFSGSVTLDLDADVACPALVVDGSLNVTGSKQLTSEIISVTGEMSMDSGSIVCPAMENPPEPDLAVCNGLTCVDGFVLRGGEVACPKILCGSASCRISGGEVHVDTISAIYGYCQDDGAVDAGYISARDGLSISGGTLTLGGARVYDTFFEFRGGVITINGPLETESAQVVIQFPMHVAVPEGGSYREGAFRDADGNEVKTVRLEAYPVTHPFRDVALEAFYYDAMVWAYEHDPQITNGIDDERFGPNLACTRGQVVTFLWRAAGCPEPIGAKSPFTDLKPGAFYLNAVAWAVERGITNGLTETSFGPDETCTRGQIVTFLWRFLDRPEPKRTDTGFADVEPDGFYARAVAWALENGVTKGTTKTTFAPEETCTRGQVMTFLFRTLSEKANRS